MVNLLIFSAYENQWLEFLLCFRCLRNCIMWLVAIPTHAEPKLRTNPALSCSQFSVRRITAPSKMPASRLGSSNFTTLRPLLDHSRFSRSDVGLSLLLRLYWRLWSSGVHLSLLLLCRFQFCHTRHWLTYSKAVFLMAKNILLLDPQMLPISCNLAWIKSYMMPP